MAPQVWFISYEPAPIGLTSFVQSGVVPMPTVEYGWNAGPVEFWHVQPMIGNEDGPPVCVAHMGAFLPAMSGGT